MSAADLLRELVALGLSAEQTVEVLQLIERHTASTASTASTVDVDKTSTDRRQYQAAWARKKRAKSKTSKANDIEVVDSLSTVDRLSEPDSFFLSSDSESLPTKKERSVSARARATRLEVGTLISDEWREWTRREAVWDDWKIDAVWAEFVDYWCAVPGQRGTKLNWFSTWRNRVRLLVERSNDKTENRERHSVLAAVERVKKRIGSSEMDYEPQLPPLLRLSKR